MRSSSVLRWVAAAAIGTALAAPAAAEGPAARRGPSAGYVFPAGGRRGTTIPAIVGGQNLAGVRSAFVTGEGVRATVVRHVPSLNRRQQGELRRRVAALTAGRPIPEPRPGEERIDLPRHPLLDRLEALSPRELRDAALRFLGAGERRQPNPQIEETVEIEVAVDAAAPPGDRELRLLTPAGLTNPLRFQVGDLPEADEAEPLPGGAAEVPIPGPPALVNGRILPGDADRFRFRARRGQRIEVSVAARRLVPFLADAVPGWFQATVSLRDDAGREVAFCDDWRFDPDPRFAVTVPRDGDYVVEIRDALWRGREDFVYRLAVAEAPAPGTAPLPAEEVSACREEEPGDDGPGGQEIRIPAVVDARIGRPGDRDVFRFEGRAGDDVVAEVEGRRLLSPVDPVIWLEDGSGKVLAWNDDHPEGGVGILTHEADPWLRARLPADGTYRLRVADAQGHGGEAYAYRLRLGPPRPGFSVAAIPSSLSVPAGRSAILLLRAVRRDGHAGPIEVSLVDPPAGFVLSGGRIPPGKDAVRATLTAPPDPSEAPVSLRLEARGEVGGREFRAAVIPAEERMQAFLWTHLVPSQELAVAVTGRARGPSPVAALPALPVRIPAGGTAAVRIRARGLPRDLRLDLVDPPEGIRLEGVEVRPDSLRFVLEADPAKAPPGTGDNLIVGAYLERVPPAGKDGAAGPPRKVPVGILPAIPFEVIGR